MRVHAANRGSPYALLRFGSALATTFLPGNSALTGFFFDALTASRLLRSAAIRSTTLVGASSTSAATYSSPATRASMI